MVEAMEIKEGFTRTEVGVIPKDWSVPKLFEISNFENGKAHEQFIDEKGDFIVVNSKFISTEGRVSKYSNEFICPLKKGNITIVMSDIPNGKALAKCFMIDKDNRYTLNQRIGSIISKENVNSDFLFYKLNRNKYFLAFDSGTGQTNLRKNEILNCPVSIPSTLAEQTAIASALNDADALITQLEKLIAKKRAIKQGAMQELLKPKEGWEEKKLGEIGTFKNGINKSSDDFGFGYPFVNLMDVFGKSHISSNIHLGLLNSNALERKMYDLAEGDVVFIRSSVKPEGVGLTCVIKKDLPDTVFSGFIIRYRDSGTLSTEFKEYCFYSSDFRNRIISSSTVSANTNINQVALKDLTISFPREKSEQTRIAQILSDMDAELEGLEKKLEKYKKIKQGMMQELLTGRIRLNH